VNEHELTEALRLARRELKLARGKQEAAEEKLQRVRRERQVLQGRIAELEAIAGGADVDGVFARLRRRGR
jgi:chromosome segregation ATPase